MVAAGAIAAIYQECDIGGNRSRALSFAMLYTALAWSSRRALRWCYRDVTMVGDVPHTGPVLLAVNHPNDLPDICAILGHVRRRVSFVANVTAAEQPLVAWAYARMGVVPIHRVRDARKARARGLDSSQANDRAFARVRELLAGGACVCVFPEGGVHRGPHLGALRTGLARMALDARDQAGLRGLQIVPVGITYESPLEYRTRVLIEIGAPLELDHWTACEGRRAESQLTVTIGIGMRAVTRNAPDDAAERALSAVALISAAQTPEATLLTATRHWRSLASEIYGPGIALEAGEDPRLAPARELVGQLGALPAGDSPALLLRAWKDAALGGSGSPVTSRNRQPTQPTRPTLVDSVRAIPGLVLHGPAWLAVRRIARATALTAHDVIPRTIIPGLYLMAAWYVVLALVIAAALVRLGVGAWSSLLAALALLCIAPALGDAAMRWLDRAADQRRVRLIARELPDLTARIDHAVQAMHAAPHELVSTPAASPEHNQREVI